MDTGAPLSLPFFDDREVGYQQKFRQAMETLNAAHQGLVDGSIPVPLPPPVAPMTYNGAGGVIDLSAGSEWLIAPAAPPITVTGILAPAPVVDGVRKRLWFPVGGVVSMNHNDGGAPAADRVLFRTAKNMNLIGAPALVPVEYVDLVYFSGVGWVQAGGSFGMGQFRTVAGANLIPGWPAPAVGATEVVLSVAPTFIPRTASAVRVAVFNNAIGVGAFVTTSIQFPTLAFTEFLAFDDTLNSIGVVGAGQVALNDQGQFGVVNATNLATGSQSFGFLSGWYS